MKTTLEWVQWPNSTGPALTTINEPYGMIAFVEIDHDLAPEDPLDTMDGVGIILSRCSRHANFATVEQFEAAIADPDHVPLNYFEHSGSLWWVEGDERVHIPDLYMRFDNVNRAGIWTPDNEIRVTADDKGLVPESDERRAWMREQAKSACDLYNKFINGEVYCFSLVVHRLRRTTDGQHIYDDAHDYRHEEPLHADSCCGIYGTEDMIEHMRDVAGVANTRVEVPAVQ